ASASKRFGYLDNGEPRIAKQMPHKIKILLRYKRQATSRPKSGDQVLSHREVRLLDLGLQLCYLLVAARSVDLRPARLLKTAKVYGLCKTPPLRKDSCWSDGEPFNEPEKPSGGGAGRT